ncbi:VPLPA-CTERM sorting domain-containing protein [Desulfobulbus rhabdoformis]|uniref:VPLPA-CTERM sorting domain-containing protein n=1 Tax=Desulfobulbus rhabdoformis TaxID=34032 RepID=UPI001965C5BB|nr:VPLPA-CTERM sorting domain-containing protein [Desulfobulbus rhabdoformis]MBM9616811.1 VPLPA-CTERM sorting domain-containing protein [Desulfobulbus rhabdoformis]
MKSRKLKTKTSLCKIAGALLVVGLWIGSPLQSYASSSDYSITFTDGTTGETGTGSFSWNADTQAMTGLTVSFQGWEGSVSDAGLATSYKSWDEEATYGRFFYNVLTDPLGYLYSQGSNDQPLNGSSRSLTSSSGALEGELTWISLGAELDADKLGATTTYCLNTQSWGIATAAPVPVPSTSVLLFTSLAALGLCGRRRRDS